jgi:hypothetical protein
MAGRDCGFFNNYFDNIHEVGVIASGDCIHLIAMQEGGWLYLLAVPRLILPGRQILYLIKLHLAHAGAGPRKDKENEIVGGGCCGEWWRVSTTRVVL